MAEFFCEDKVFLRTPFGFVIQAVFLLQRNTAPLHKDLLYMCPRVLMKKKL